MRSPFSTALKYVKHTMEMMKHKPADSEEDPSILGKLKFCGLD